MYSWVRSTLVTATLIGAAIPGARAAGDIVVGATVPITGAFAASGVQYHNSLLMAEADINKAGGINGKKFRIQFEDTQASNSFAVTAFIRLEKELHPPVMFLSSLSTQDLAIEPEVAKAKVPALYAGGLVALQERNNPWMFRIRPPDSLQAQAIALAVKQLGKTKPAIIYTQDDYGKGAADAVEAQLKLQGIAVVDREAFSPRDNDFSAQLTGVKNKGADVIIAFTYNRDGALILRQRRQLGINLPLIGGPGIPSPSTLALVTPDDLVDVYGMTDTVLGASVSPASADFVARYTKAYGFPPDQFGAAYYDAAMIVANGLRKVGPDREKLREYFATLKDYQGIARVYYTDAAHNMGHTEVLVKFVPGGKTYVAVSTFPPAAPK